ncbi:MAG TPA: BA14K family protein [Pseudolabrys sp.]|nr:BA14K family protein [Pseudolabrys sp.]
MQFLVYLTVLMVSISTVLLEIHWLTTPPPQPKPAVQASATPPRPKVEGPNAELSPIYPRRVEPARPTSAAANEIAAKIETGQKPAAETPGIATRADDSNRFASAPPPHNAQNAQAYAPPPKQNASDEAAASNNRCDIQTCANAYKSFRASDCTYQPFGGPRRVCGMAPEQRADRELRDEPQRRSWSPREDSREVDQRTRWRVYDEDDDNADDVVLFRRSRRW